MFHNNQSVQLLSNWGLYCNVWHSCILPHLHVECSIQHFSNSIQKFPFLGQLCFHRIRAYPSIIEWPPYIIKYQKLDKIIQNAWLVKQASRRVFNALSIGASVNDSGKLLTKMNTCMWVKVLCWPVLQLSRSLFYSYKLRPRTCRDDFGKLCVLTAPRLLFQKFKHLHLRLTSY